jgi:hypothetical protein
VGTRIVKGVCLSLLLSISSSILQFLFFYFPQ